MIRMNTVVVDDEPVARKGIEGYVCDTTFLSLVGSAEDTIRAGQLLAGQSVDLLLLDIQMPRQSGLEFLSSLEKAPLCIFITAHPDYALQGFALDVVDYLLKPVSFERFTHACQKAYEIFCYRQSLQRATADFFFVKVDSKLEKVMFADVTYVEAMQNYVIIHTPTRKLITYLTMSGVEAQLPSEAFIRVHKSFIVAVQHVQAIDGNDLLIGDSRIPLSRSLKETVMHKIVGNRFFKR